jgi:hypothetical protein
MEGTQPVHGFRVEVTTPPALAKASCKNCLFPSSFARADLTTHEFDLSFVEAIEHLNARGGVLHALQFEQ